MATLLHLTDLHLDTPADFAGADFKSDIVPLHDRPDRLGALKSTFQTLADSQWTFDAVVITGDIPYQNGRATQGWEQFDGVFEPLEQAGKLPPPERIVVTPGNHDVAWRLAVGDRSHYAKFLEHVRIKGYVTPLLDGIDINTDGQITSSGRHYLLDVDRGFVVVPVNSSHYCGALEPMGTLSNDDWDKALGMLRRQDADLAEKVAEQIVALRSQDIARISEPQFIALTILVGRIKQSLAGGSDPRRLVWIAALHHHLLPVSTDEEFKSYESMTNLGRFRQLLVDLGFDVVLHGHKHSGGVFWDHVHLKDSGLRDADPRLLVVSGSTAGARREGTQEMARIIRVFPAATERSVTVSKVPILDLGARLPEPLRSERASLWTADMALEPGMPHRITGPTPSVAYDRIQALFAGLLPGQAALHLTCEIRSPEGAERPPASYPIDRLPGGAEQADTWFRETVEWWQRDGSRFHFTHGERLRAWGSQQINQVEDATRLLQNDPVSSRAVITLIDPATDKLADESIAFPAFSFAHVLIRSSRDEPRKLDCVGFFRKQEMRFWWPINVAELAALQRHVFNRLSQPDLQLGSIITYASIAHLGSEVPAVNVTDVDRLADAQPDVLWTMAYGLVHPEAVDAAAVKRTWLRVLADLQPAEGARPPRPLVGIDEVLGHIERFGRHAADNQLGAIRDTLRRLKDDYTVVDGWPSDVARERITESLDKLREQIDNRVPSGSGSTLPSGTGVVPGAASEATGTQ